MAFTINRCVRRAAGKINRNKPFCKWCFDAGKSEREYTSHYIKDSRGPNGRVICPTLLAHECRFCHETGHTKRHCHKLHQVNRRKQQEEKTRRRNASFLAAENRLRRQVEQETTKETPINVELHTGRFAALSCQETPMCPRATSPTPFAVPALAKSPPLQGAWAIRIRGSPSAQEKVESKPLKKKLPTTRAKKARWADLCDELSSSEDECDW